MSYSTLPIDHCCYAWPGDDSIIPPDIEARPYDQFYIKFYADFMYPPAHLNENEEEVEEDYLQMDAQDNATRSMEFYVPSDQLADSTSSWSTISGMLSRLGVPLDIQPFMIYRISYCAATILASGSHDKVKPILVSISVLVDLDYNEEVFGEFTGPTSESSLRVLEKVRVEELGEVNQCVICLQGLEVDCEATRLPCSHLYHGGCIVNWLRVSNLCPLCRFQMPN